MEEREKKLQASKKKSTIFIFCKIKKKKGGQNC